MNILLFFHVSFTFLFSFCTCGNQNPIRRTKYGRVRGFTETVYDGKKVEKYLGIPYAKPPIGELRFMPPVVPKTWHEGTLNAIELGPACPQHSGGLAYIELHVPGFNKTSEDCLYLNVYTPKKGHHFAHPLPVLVFIHGGSYYTGMGAIFDGSALAAQDIVVVSINYRIGALGFLATGDADLPGNYGMLDIIAALQWTRDNIAYFHGDPDLVTIDGHSAGGSSAGLVMMSPLAKGLFRRVILQSGSPLAHWAVTRYPGGQSVHFKVFASAFDCLFEDSAQIKKCLQAVPSKRMHAFIGQNHDASPSLSPQFRPVVDGYFMPDTPERMAVSGDFEVESVLTGATKDEGLIAAIPFINAFGGQGQGRAKLLTLMYCFRGDLPEIPGIVDTLLEHYTQWPYITSDSSIKDSFSEMVGDYYITAPTHRIASRLSQRNTTVYLYNYEYKSVYALWDGVVHGAELFYLSGFPMSGHVNFRYSESDRKMSETLLYLWSSFARNGLPSLIPHKQFYIDRYTPSRPVFARITAGNQRPHIEMDIKLKPDKISFWNEKVPELYRQRYANRLVAKGDVMSRDYVISSANSWALIASCIGLSVLTILFSIGYCKSRRRIKKILQHNGVPMSNRII
ncbi:cholinesterase 1-like isoform X2 [Mizuhopecten yessoensis]|uniref:Acetylcholinesterase n=1 Tax=Mizuhopecten yessoensis TaxID=6573 RepID=A0A210R5N9_MIZYE|nr:cholinesterase 1-like isoform X2 [Mizuhopecten yessoensis]OWF56350.1 Acetylcholinesterase [Mizuhopecten yessoensis]